jgi:hypothetical protein
VNSARSRTIHLLSHTRAIPFRVPCDEGRTEWALLLGPFTIRLEGRLCCAVNWEIRNNSAHVIASTAARQSVAGGWPDPQESKKNCTVAMMDLTSVKAALIGGSNWRQKHYLCAQLPCYLQTAEDAGTVDKQCASSSPWQFALLDCVSCPCLVTLKCFIFILCLTSCSLLRVSLYLNLTYITSTFSLTLVHHGSNSRL